MSYYSYPPAFDDGVVAPPVDGGGFGADVAASTDPVLSRSFPATVFNASAVDYRFTGVRASERASEWGYN